MGQFNVDEATAGRLDIFVAHAMEIPRVTAQKLVKAGAVEVDDVVVKKASLALRPGMRIDVKSLDVSSVASSPVLEKKTKRLIPEIIIETDDYVVINKPAWLLVHPTTKKETDTLADWLRERYPDIAGVGEDPDRPGIVHRLDKEASGVMVVARTQPMFDHLKKAFQARTVEKHYSVLVHGKVAKDHGVIDFPIGRSSEGRMAARPVGDGIAIVDEESAGKPAITEFLVEKRFARFTLLDVRIHTGRTHQIRVHMYAYTHPVVGDTLYLNKKLPLKRDRKLGRLFLHARSLSFPTLAGDSVSYTVPLPKALQDFLADLN